MGETFWTEERVAEFKELYQTLPMKDISARYNKSEKALYTKASRLGLRKQIFNAWTKEEIRKLRKLYPNYTSDHISTIINRTPLAIDNKACELKIRKKSVDSKPWTHAECEFLIQNYSDGDLDVITRALNRSYHSVICKAHNLGIKRDADIRYKDAWSDADIKLLKELYPKTHARKLVHIFNRSEATICLKANELGIKAIRYYHRPDMYLDDRDDYYEYLIDTERAYIAGLIDGEGHIQFIQRSGSKGYYQCKVQIGNTDKKMIDYLQSKVPGYIYERPDKRPNRSTLWRWELTSDTRTMQLLRVVYPYLITKKDKAKQVLDYWENVVRSDKTIFEHNTD